MSAPTVASLSAELGPDLRPAPGFVAPATEISAVHISELPDPGTWLSGGELLLTTGLGLTEDDQASRVYVERLVAARVVALGLGLGPVHDELPGALRDACREAGLPLLIVPAPTPFITVSRAYWTAVARSGEQEATDQLAAQRALIDATAQREPAQAILRTLAAWLQGWTAQLTAGGDLARVQPPEAVGRAEAVGELLRRTGSSGSRQPVSLGVGRGRAISVPLESGGQRVGYLAVGTPRRTGPTMRRTVLTAAALLSLANSRDALDETAREAHLSDLASLLEAGMVDAARHVAEGAGLVVPGDRLRILAVRTTAPALMASTVMSWHMPIAGVRLDARRLWYALSPGTPSLESLGERIAALDPLAAATISAPVPAEDCRAERSRRLAVLEELPDGELDLDRDAPRDVAARLELLTDPALREAVTAYLRHRGQWEAASRASGVHRNTLRHRVGRAGRILGLDLDDPDVGAILWLALRRLPEGGADPADRADAAR